MVNPGLIVAPLTPFTADLEVDTARASASDRLRRRGLRRHHGRRRRRRNPGIHLSQPRTAQGPDPAHHRVRRRPRAGHGGYLPPVLQDRGRAGASGARARRGRGAAVGADAPVRRAADAGRSHRLFRGDRARDRSSHHALSQSRARRRRVHCRHHRPGEASRACSSSRRARAIWRGCRASSSRSIAPATPAISRPCRCCWRRCSWAAPARPCRRRDRRSRGTSSTPSWPRTTSARSSCSFSSRCSRRSGCIGASPPS